jgi:hypothetical protein
LRVSVGVQEWVRPSAHILPAHGTLAQFLRVRIARVFRIFSAEAQNKRATGVAQVLLNGEA